MNAKLLSILVFGVVCLVLGESSNSSRSILSRFFPKCIDFDVAMVEKRREMIRKGEITGKCKPPNKEVCVFNELMLVRSKIPREQPSQECIEQMGIFIFGNDDDFYDVNNIPVNEEYEEYM